MARYKAWCPDYTEEDSAQEIESYSPDEAAEALAETYHNYEPFGDSMEIHVKTMSGELSKWTVYAEPYVSFSSHEVRE